MQSASLNRPFLACEEVGIEVGFFNTKRCDPGIANFVMAGFGMRTQ